MREEKKMICGLPALELGEPSERVFFYVHGKWGSKEEARDFAAAAACPRGWQVVLSLIHISSTVSVRPWKMAELDMPVPLEGMAS